jgi:hypothetical protein
LKELATFARGQKQAGVSVINLVQVQKTEACPGNWYNGLQICDHINGSFPAADGTLEEWQKLMEELRPMRFMWWANLNYWSVQGQVWAQALADKKSDVGKWFSWGVTSADQCWGSNPEGAQGSWGSDGKWAGFQSALASWGTDTYADYLVDALANSWMGNLGLDGFTNDCITCYEKGTANCESGMLQTPGGSAMAAWAKIVTRIRELQPQVAMSGEWYNSWDDVIKTNSDIANPAGWEWPSTDFHEQMQNAVFRGDAADLETKASTSGADAATVLCYLNPAYDGKQPGGCPSMYFRDTTETLRDVNQFRMWVALEAASGVMPQHDFDQQKWWNVEADPFDDTASPLWAFTKYRPLNRLALRTKLETSGLRGSLAYLKHDSMGPYGDAAILLFNPGSAGHVTTDLSLLPSSLFGVVPYDLLGKEEFLSQTGVLPLSKSWTVEMGAGEMKFFSGFTLGVYAPRKGKKSECESDDQYKKTASAATLQACFLECHNDRQCENIFVEYVDVEWLQAPPSIKCMLLGAIANPASACHEGTGTLIKKLPGARTCAWQWPGEVLPPARGAPPVQPGPSSPSCIPPPTPPPTPAPPSQSPTISPTSTYFAYQGKNCYDSRGGITIDLDGVSGLSVAMCEARCTADESCSCVTHIAESGQCWKRAVCVPSLFSTDAKYDVYVKDQAYSLARGKNCYGDRGGTDIDDGVAGLSVKDCEARCDADQRCSCVTYEPARSQCWKRAQCDPSGFVDDDSYDVYVKAAPPSFR